MLKQWLDKVLVILMIGNMAIFTANCTLTKYVYDCKQHSDQSKIIRMIKLNPPSNSTRMLEDSGKQKEIIQNKLDTINASLVKLDQKCTSTRE